MQTKNIDYKLFFAVVALLIFGLIMISSVSVYGSFRVTSQLVQAGLIDEAYNHFYVLRSISHFVIALLIIGVISKVPYRFFEKYAYHIFSIALILLVAVLFVGWGHQGAQRWIDIPGLPFNVQPSETIKFAIIVFLAAFFKKYSYVIHRFKEGFVPFILIIGVVFLLLAMQPDFGSILIVVPVAFMMYFIAGANIKYMFLMFILGFFLAFGVYTAGDYDRETGRNLNNLGYITQRIDNFLENKQDAIENNRLHYQTEQALIAIGSGGFTGLGFGNSIQKFGYLPEVQGDFIFSVIVEELGFIGALILLNLYMYIFYRGMMISRYSPDAFASYAAAGISCWIFLQACINIGVNLNIVPLTGITLPFVSYGGSSMISISIGLAVLLSISRHIDEDEYHKKWKRKHRFSLRKTFQRFKRT
ncbi:putative lipid II flippase FtsW [Candidatus Gracilibacteria bacterium]|nr:putative lipid II flippase FtsW [Candidatus Gracilibacteria bacterium]